MKELLVMSGNEKHPRTYLELAGQVHVRQAELLSHLVIARRRADAVQRSFRQLQHFLEHFVNLLTLLVRRLSRRIAAVLLMGSEMKAD